MDIDTISVEDIMADYPEVMGVWPNPNLATVIALCRDVQAKTFNACEAVARLHQTYDLPDFPPAFSGGYGERRRTLATPSPRLRTNRDGAMWVIRSLGWC